jgi:ParB-like chromosome segregation protein Spo0J
VGVLTKQLSSIIQTLSVHEQVKAINSIKIALHRVSPMRMEPVDCVIWVPQENVRANDYNPNAVAPPEMQLLEVSILEDGYTQPIVTFVTEGINEVVDGFHRTRVGKESADVRNRVHGLLPVVRINAEREEKGDRIAATIRHNRARGKHRIDAMSEIVLDLKRRNWSDKKIARELGMDADEILRLSQITGLAEMFNDRQFSEAWEADTNIIDETDDLAAEPVGDTEGQISSK